MDPIEAAAQQLGFDFSAAPVADGAVATTDFLSTPQAAAAPQDLAGDVVMDAAATAFDVQQLAPGTAAAYVAQPQPQQRILIAAPDQQQQQQPFFIIKQPQQEQQTQQTMHIVPRIIPQQQPHLQYQQPMEVDAIAMASVPSADIINQQVLHHQPQPDSQLPVQDSMYQPVVMSGPSQQQQPLPQLSLLQQQQQQQQQPAEDLHDNETAQDEADSPAEDAPVPSAPAASAKPTTPTKRARRKKDPNAPAAVSSAYAFFFKETQASVKTHNPNAKFGEVSKIVASMWDALDEEGKRAFRAKNEEDKARFDREMRAYKQKLESGELQQPGGEATQQPDKKGGRVAVTRGSHGSVRATKVSNESEESAASDESSPAAVEVMGHSCIRTGCARKAVRNVEWEDEYCSNECVVAHCKDVFNNWIKAG